jgi:hypothetical protein
MTDKDHKFLHDIMNELAKIDGFVFMLKMELGEDNSKLMKVEKAAAEAIELVQNYMSFLQKSNQ